MCIMLPMLLAFTKRLQYIDIVKWLVILFVIVGYVKHHHAQGFWFTC